MNRVMTASGRLEAMLEAMPMMWSDTPVRLPNSLRPSTMGSPTNNTMARPTAMETALKGRLMGTRKYMAAPKARAMRVTVRPLPPCDMVYRCRAGYNILSSSLRRRVCAAPRPSRRGSSP